jgi:hypothetical protein
LDLSIFEIIFLKLSWTSVCNQFFISFSETIISSDNICHTVSEVVKTASKPVNVLRANLAAILFTSHGWVSDSWTIIFLRRINHAKTTGKATYHHLQNITSMRK